MIQSKKIMGIDPGTKHTGISVLDVSTNIIETYTVEIDETLTGKLKLIKMSRDVMNIIKKVNPILIGIEDYAFGGAFFNVMVPELMGMLFLQMKDFYKGKIIMIPPNTAKKVLTGNGRAKKGDIKKAVKEKYDIIDSGTVHEYDSIAILETLHRFARKTLDADLMKKLNSRIICLQ